MAKSGSVSVEEAAKGGPIADKVADAVRRRIGHL